MPKKSNGAVHHSRLYVRTLELLRNRPATKTLRGISDDTGLPEAWLAKILTAPRISPSVDRICILYEYLSKKQLDCE